MFSRIILHEVEHFLVGLLIAICRLHVGGNVLEGGHYAGNELLRNVHASVYRLRHIPNCFTVVTNA